MRRRPPLSRKEEATFRRIAEGLLEGLDLTDVRRLVRLELVELVNGTPALSEIGRFRYRVLVKPPNWISDRVFVGGLSS